MNGVLVSVAAFIAVFGIAYVFLTGRHRERIAMIERGVDAKIFTEESQSISYTLKFGMLFVGIALGILVNNLVAVYFYLEMFSMVGLIFLFAGLSLIANFMVERKFEKKKE